jgi:hypothetical protein
MKNETGHRGIDRGLSNRKEAKEGYEGRVIIYDGPANFSDMAEDELLFLTGGIVNAAYDERRDVLSNEVKSKVWTHIASQYNREEVFGEIFSINSVKNGKVSFGNVEGASWVTRNCPDGSFELLGTDRYSYETTVENVQATLVYHEWYGHGKKKYGDRTLDHTCCYEAVIEYPIFQKSTTNRQNFVKRVRNWHEFS